MYSAKRSQQLGSKKGEMVGKYEARVSVIWKIKKNQGIF
jgi:hypothetical protein